MKQRQKIKKMKTSVVKSSIFDLFLKNYSSKKYLLKFHLCLYFTVIFASESPSSDELFNRDYELISYKDVNSEIHTDLNVCEICWCNKKDALSCKRKNELTSIPVLRSKNHRFTINEIIIENQENFTVLDETQLKYYPNITKLTIQNCGLRHVDEDAFRGVKNLREISFRNNKIKVLAFRAFRGLRLDELTLDGNPFVCNCSSKWIQRQIHKKVDGILGEFFDQIICVDQETGIEQRLVNVTFDGCELPKVVVYPKEVVINESESAEFTCIGTGKPKPRVYWNVTGLQSSLNFTDKESVDFISTNSTFLEPNFSTQVVLNVHRARVDDNRNLICIAENIVGKAFGTSLLKINSPPKVISMIATKCFDWCIKYMIIGVPLPTKIWYFNNKPLNYTKIIRDVTVSKNRFQITGHLELGNAGHLIDGLYTLRLINIFEDINKSIEAQFHIKNLPPLYSAPLMKNQRNRPPFPPVTIDSRKPSGKDAIDDQTFFNNEKIIILLIAASALVSIIIGILIFKRRYKRNGIKTEFLKISERIRFNIANLVENPNYFGEKEDETLNDFDTEVHHIAREKISFVQILGEGAFGRVFLGTVDFLKPDEPTTLVAVKTLKDVNEEEAKKSFEREAQLLASLKHNNIVKFHGVSVEGNVFMMLFEYMEYGDLNKFLRANGPDNAFSNSGSSSKHIKLEFIDLLKIAHQICLGMSYLSEQHFVHRDLATRNCLVGEGIVVKIADFGMSRDVYATDYYRVGRQTVLPIRWMAPESILYRKFTIESDIWSFGVVLWEIFTFGKQPFYELSNHEVIDAITNQRYLCKPDKCPEIIYEIMSLCWKQNALERTPFSKLCDIINTEINADSQYIQVIE